METCNSQRKELACSITFCNVIYTLQVVTTGSSIAEEEGGGWKMAIHCLSSPQELGRSFSGIVDLFFWTTIVDPSKLSHFAWHPFPWKVPFVEPCTIYHIPPLSKQIAKNCILLSHLLLVGILSMMLDSKMVNFANITI